MNGRNGIKAIVNGFAEHKLHITLFNEIPGFDTIGRQDQATQIDAGVLDFGNFCQIPSNAALADHNMKPHPQSFQNLCGIDRLVAGGNPAGNIGGKFFVAGSGRMSFQGFTDSKSLFKPRQ